MTCSVGFERRPLRCIIGALPEERTTPQKIELDLRISYDAAEAIKSDELACAIDYTEAARVAEELLSSAKFHLIEAACGGIASLLRTRFPRIEALSVRISKVERGGYFAELRWTRT